MSVFVGDVFGGKCGFQREMCILEGKSFGGKGMHGEA